MTPEHPEWYLITLADLQPRAAVRRFRQSIKDEWGCCAYCGRKHNEKGELLELSLDHVIPRRWGGDNYRRNLVPACLRCNRDKGSIRSYLDWWQSTDYFCPERAAKVAAWISHTTDTWTIGEQCNGQAERRATIHSQTSRAGSPGTKSRGACRGLAGLLGGALQAQSSLHGIQSGCRAVLSIGRSQKPSCA
ncbi:MAG: hypothetical protein CMJ39_00315 [Phycisphaerae bacterium]|nr:hypothetical protein [Phycisphaerae bacterium]